MVKENGKLDLPENVIEQLDAVAVAKDKDREEVLDEALQTYLDSEMKDEEMRQDIVEAYREDRINFKQLKSVVGVEAASDYQAHKRKLVDEVLTNGRPQNEE